MPPDIQMNHLPDDVFQRIASPIEEAVDSGVAPAVGLCVYHGDSALLNAAWGWIDPNAQQHAVTVDTYFDLASLTKLYTTVALLQQISAGQATLETPLSQIVPEFSAIAPRPIGGGQDPHTKQPQPVDARYAGQSVDPAQVTLRHLLTHTSGLPAWRDVYTVAAVPSPRTDADSVGHAERWSWALERLCAYAFVAPPEADVRYSDIGLMLLGEVVSRLGNAPLDTVLARDVDENALFRPLDEGISRQQIAPTESDATWRKRRVWGEVHDENACGVGGVAGHAGLFATAHHVADFGQRWLSRQYAIDESLYAQATTLQAQSGAEVRGLGWMLKSDENSSAGDLFTAASYGHTGFTGTSLWIDPQAELVVTLLTNRVYGGREKPGIHALRRTVHDAIAQAVEEHRA